MIELQALRSRPSGAFRGVMTDVRATTTVLRAFRPVSWLAAVGAAGLAALLIGLPTRLIANDWFVRMTPTRTQDYVLMAISAALFGLIAGTYVLGRTTSHEASVVSGGLVSFLAVGCPICNKLVVLALGVSGAMTYFAPAQLFIGLASVAFLAWTLLLRARSLTTVCPLPAAAPGASAPGAGEDPGIGRR